MTTWDEEQALKAAYEAGFATACELAKPEAKVTQSPEPGFNAFLAKHHGGRRMTPMEVHRGNHATLERLLSRDTKVRLSIAGVFDADELGEIVKALSALGAAAAPPIDRTGLEHLKRVRNYFRDIAGASVKASEVDARRYRRLRVLGAAVVWSGVVAATGLPAPGDGLTPVKRFQNLDDLLDDDLRAQPSRGEAEPDRVVDWNREAKEALDDVVRYFNEVLT